MKRGLHIRSVGKDLRVVAFYSSTILITILVRSSFSDEDLYHTLTVEAKEGSFSYLSQLRALEITLDWGCAAETEFEGNLRFIKSGGTKDKFEKPGLFLVRRLDGELYIISLPPESEIKSEELRAYYRSMGETVGHKLRFKALVSTVAGSENQYTFIRLLTPPQKLITDLIFRNSVIFMFFFVMLGMGLNLSVGDFMLAMKTPRGFLLGIVLQWVLMPLLTLGVAIICGFYHNFPFIYAGMILICSCPGGVTSNLMTYYAKGDLALSVSLTSVSTLLALFFTPLILSVFCRNIPAVFVPAGLIFQTIFGLVLIPLIIGMIVRLRYQHFARRATPFFSALGVVALLFVISAGVFTNLEKFADTQRYSLLFYIAIVSLTFLGMAISALLPKICKVDNYQTRAISMEVGLRNSTLAVTIALLLQDLMGDYHSSMFVAAAIYGMSMYVTGFLMIIAYKKLLPVSQKVQIA